MPYALTVTFQVDADDPNQANDIAEATIIAAEGSRVSLLRWQLKDSHGNIASRTDDR